MKCVHAQIQNPTADEEETHLPDLEVQHTTTKAKEQPHKCQGRGRPKKAAATATTIKTLTDHVVQDSAPIKGPPQKCTCKDTIPAGEPAYKHAKADVAHQDPLPDCAGHNIHPAPKRQIRRSSQEVEAEHEAQRKAIEEKIQELEEVKCCLAEMNISENIQDDAMGQHNPQRLSIAIHKCWYVELRLIVTMVRTLPSEMLTRCQKHLRLRNFRL